jgi:protein TonB
MATALGPVQADRPRPEGEGRGIAAAFLVALGLHVGTLALVALWRSATVVSPPGEQEITIDLAPQMVEAPAVAPVEASTPAGAPAEAVPIEPLEAVTAQPVAPEPLPEAPPVEMLALAPPEATPVEAVLPPDAAPIASGAAEAIPLPPVMAPPPEPESVVAALPPPEAVTARPLPEPRPVPRPVERKAQPKPEPRPKPEPVQRERPRPVQAAARPGAAGQGEREAQRGASSRENMGGAAAASADPNAMSRYVAQVAAALKARLRYPDAARAAGVAGSATLRFTMHRSGRVLQASIARSAGHPALDQAALATATPGSSLPAAPDGVPQQQMTITVPLRFDMR